MDQTSLNISEGYERRDVKLRAQNWIRQIGWIDQKGRVYRMDEEWPKPFDGGSMSPLLIEMED